MTDLASPHHPVWPIMRLVVMLTALLAVLYMNATSFDATEVKTLFEYVLIAAGIEGGVRGVRAALKGGDGK